MEKTELFERAPIYKAVVVMALPLTMSLLAVVLYSLFGMYFLGQKGNPLMIAAVALGSPLGSIMMSIGNIFGLGGCSIFARVMGQHDEHKLKQIFGFSFWTSLFVGIIMMIVVIVLEREVAVWLGASKDTMEYTLQYLTWTIPSIPFVTVTYVLTNLLRTSGSPNAAMIGSIGATLLNLFASWLFIMVLDLGVVGSALAATVANIAGVIYYVIVILVKRGVLSLHPKYFAVKGIAGPVLAIGVPIACSYLFTSIAQIIMNNLLESYGDFYIAAMGVALRVASIVLMLEMGFCNGVQPLLGYCYGGKLFARLKQFLRFSTITAVVISTVFGVLCFVFASPIAGYLGNDADLTPLAATMIRGQMLVSPILGLFFIHSALVQAMGKAVSTAVLSVSRQGVILIGALLIMRAVFGLMGIVYAQAVSDVICTVVAFCMYLHYRKEFRDDALPTAA